MYTTTFEEPRAWALEWDGAALAAAAEPRPAREMPGMPWQRMALPVATFEPRNGAGVFSDPRSWALAWEGSGLADARTWQAPALRVAAAL